MSVPTNILYLLMSGSKVGGAEIQYLNLISALDRSRYNPIAVCPDRGDLYESLVSQGVETLVMKLPMWRQAKSLVVRYRARERLIRLARERSIGIIHSEFRMNNYLLGVSEALAIPAVSHLRTPVKPDHIRKYAFDQVSLIISISNRLRQPLLDFGLPPEKIPIINDSVDLDLFKPRPSQMGVLDRDYPSHPRPYVGLVGRIEPFKRQLEFVRIAEKIIRKGRKATFFIIGEVQSETYMDELCKALSGSRASNHVIMTGKRSDMPEVMSSLDILVTLSGGSVVTEAMASARPVVAASKPMPPDWHRVKHGRTGFMVPYDEIDAVADALITLIDNPGLRVRMGIEGRKEAEEKYGHLKMANETQKLYDSLLRESGV